jgi:archaeal flagellar protein FlaI
MVSKKSKPKKPVNHAKHENGQIKAADSLPAPKSHIQGQASARIAVLEEERKEEESVPEEETEKEQEESGETQEEGTEGSEGQESESEGDVEEDEDIAKAKAEKVQMIIKSGKAKHEDDRHGKDKEKKKSKNADMEYDLESENIQASVEISKTSDFVLSYELKFPNIALGTSTVLDKIRSMLLTEIPIKPNELTSIASIDSLKKKFYERGIDVLQKEVPYIDDTTQKFLIGSLMQDMFGLGRIEFLLADPNLEEVVINGAQEPVWVYHKKMGWLKSNVVVNSESEILNYANNIGRKVGRQITLLNPLMDAHLTSGDRVNATLFPVSTHGNTITIRKFRRSPWTITDFIENKTLTPDVAAWIWLAIQYEMNMIVAGGTASGKTSLLNVFLTFIPPNHRIISIEDTRELQLADFLHWIPLTTREPNAEGLGEVSMLDLLVNSLRMRPDRIVVGEIRKAREAEVLFEAMHTGHSVYATLHADTAELALKRLLNPPIDVPEAVVEALHMFAVAFRDRRQGLRRMIQLAEVLPRGEKGGANANVLYRWKPTKDIMEKENESFRLLEEIRMHTGMSDDEIKSDIKDKVDILEWLVKRQVRDLNMIGRMVAIYYADPEYVTRTIKKDISAEAIIKGWFG